MLAVQLNGIRFSARFEACKERMEGADSVVNEIDLMYRDPHKYVYEYFAELKRQVDFK
jgi:hypothetical protein